MIDTRKQDNDFEDLSDEELEEIYRMVAEDLVNNGIPTEEELQKEFDRLNETAPEPSRKSDLMLEKALGQTLWPNFKK